LIDLTDQFVRVLGQQGGGGAVLEQEEMAEAPTKRATDASRKLIFNITIVRR
jgi:hypothetical protein